MTIPLRNLIDFPKRLYIDPASLKANTLPPEELKKHFTMCDRCHIRPALGIFTGDGYHSEAHCQFCAHRIYQPGMERSIATHGDDAFLKAGLIY